MEQYIAERELIKTPDKLTGKYIEVAGVNVKCISSNVRPSNIDWGSCQLINGIGKEGNLVIVEAITNSGFRTSIENQQGRDERIYQGDRFVAVLANRYSGTSESGFIPNEGLVINTDTNLQLLAAGAIVGINTGMPGNSLQEPLPLKSLGLVAKDNKPLDLIELCGGHHEKLNPSAPIVVICGTSAEVGKTTTSTGLIRALNNEGVKTAGTKFAGTGRMRDILSLRDAGAYPWIDFPDVGLTTTYTSPERFTKGIYTLFNHINSAKPDIIIAEAGGDPIEANIPTFLNDPKIMQYVKAFVVVAGDVMGMMGTIPYLKKFVEDKQIFLVDPKGRNIYTTRERVEHVLPGYSIFNSLNPKEVQSVAKQLLKI